MISKATAEHYVWGAGCDGWRLLQRPELSVIHERMPAGTAEVRHVHRVRRQFFFVLSGTLTLEIDGRSETLAAGQGCEVVPGAAHRVSNDSTAAAEFLVLSQPAAPDDRIAAEHGASA